MKETRSRESWRMVRVSPTPPSTTSWWATSPRTRRPWTWMPSTSAPRAPSSPVEVASGTGPSPASARAAAISSAVRRGGAGGRVGLVGVVQLDDLHRLVELRRLGREPHHQHGADREVGGHQHAGALAVREPPAQGVEPVRVEAGGADDRVDAVGDAELQVVHHHVGVGEVDDRLRRRRRPAPAARRRRRSWRPARGRRRCGQLPRPRRTRPGRPCPAHPARPP